MDEGISRIFHQTKFLRLNSERIGRRMYAYRVVGSTNELAYRMALKGEEEGAVVWARGQTMGKGRLGRKWQSPYGKGLYASLILRPALVPTEAAKITLLAAYSVVATIKKVTDLAEVYIKWPNDIQIKERKVCGILTEMAAEQDRVRFMVVGIGINLEADKGELPSCATTLKAETGLKMSTEEVLKGLLEEFDSQYSAFREKGFEPILQEVKRYSNILGKRVKVDFLDSHREGVALDLDSNGNLLLRLDNGFVYTVVAGDVHKIR